MFTVIGLGAAVASVMAAAPQMDDVTSSPRMRWANPNAFSAVAPATREAFVSAGFLYGEYDGRKAELEEFTVGGMPTENLLLWYTHLDTLIKGRNKGSRFRTDSDALGARYYLRPLQEGRPALAVELEGVWASTGRAVITNAFATYPGPKSYSLRLLGSMANGYDGLAGFTTVDGPTGYSANAYEVAVGRDLDVSYRWKARLQGHLVGQSIDRIGEGVNFEIKPVLYGALALRLNDRSNLEFDLTFMPSGTPIANGRLTGLNSFQIYELTGPAAGIREDAFGLATLRLTYRISY
jgi:hypothetical protein